MPQSISNGARRWLIGGRIQGVGFRSFVYTLANELGVSGSVRNRGGQVEIVARGDARRAALFLRRLMSEHPPLARPELVSDDICVPPESLGFRILPSRGGGEVVLLLDQSVCAACLTEMADPTSRRFRYPFVACTQCGPRYTIIQDMPFDRAGTGMAGFPLCAACRGEYGQVTDRRFYAQVISCADCGPRLFYRSGANVDRGSASALARTVTALREGMIVAVKGIGGYHLLCDASNTVAIDRLRARKHRPGKPLAVLFPRAGADGLRIVRRYCTPNVEEARRLSAPERPIVMVSRRDGTGLSPMLAPGLMELGALLPYSPLHELIAGDFGAPLVATSGNVSSEPVMSLSRRRPGGNDSIASQHPVSAGCSMPPPLSCGWSSGRLTRAKARWRSKRSRQGSRTALLPCRCNAVPTGCFLRTGRRWCRCCSTRHTRPRTVPLHSTPA